MIRNKFTTLNVMLSLSKHDVKTRSINNMLRQAQHDVRRFLLIFILLVQACAPSLPQKIPQSKITTPENYPDYAQTNEGENLAKQKWQVFFHDEKLISLIDEALKNNQDLNILEQEINIANNVITARQSQYLPMLGISGGYENEKAGKFTARGVDDKSAGLPEILHNRALELNATWEIDIWKKLRNSAKSAYMEYLASIEGKRFAVTQLVSEVASDYYELMALDNELETVEDFIKNLKDSEKVAELQKIAGRTTSLPIKRFTAEIAKNQSRKFEIKQQIIVTENHLNTLLGRLPGPIARSSKTFKEITLPQFAHDVPAALLDNRPDIKQASLKLEAAKLNVKSVKTKFYPSLTLNANYGYRSFNAKHFIDPTAIAYDVAGNLTAPLINRNAIKAEYFSANNEQIQAIYNYEKTFIKAFAEVSNQLAAVQNFNQVLDAKKQQTKSLADSFEISNMLFKAARVNYLELLLTRRDFLESRMELIEAKQKQIVAYVNLYRALGGGWRS